MKIRFIRAPQRYNQAPFFDYARFASQSSTMDRLRDSLLALGLPGVFLVALLDSAGIPLPGGVDLLIMLLAWQEPSLFLVTAATAATGSTLGCLVLYRLGRTGGSKAVSRLDPDKRRWVADKVRDNDTAALAVAVLAPPPFPTKIFMLVAGLVGMPWSRFVLAVFVGRMVRYTAEAYLAVRLGDRAIETLERNYPVIGACLVGGVVIYLVLKRFQRKSTSNAAG